MGDKKKMVTSLIRDNYKRGKVGEFLKSSIEPDAEISIISAYFTIYAYSILKEQLDKSKSVNFLFGEPTFIKSVDPDMKTMKQFGIEDDNLIIPMDKRLEQKAVAKECANWIEEKVQIKSMKNPNFVHGKMYHIKNTNGVQRSIVGSSNFTVKGLGLSTKPNFELNIEIDADRDRDDLYEWFNEIWDDNSEIVEDVKNEVLRYINQLYAENAPEEIYFKTLYHIFYRYLSEQEDSGLLKESTGFFESEIWKTLFDFQKDGVKGAINKILKHNGCIIADSVGLGKTFEALAIIKYFELLNYRVLVICPKKLANNWTIYRNNDERNPFVIDRLNYDVVFHTDLSRDSGTTVSGLNLDTIKWSNYDLIVIDESHNFRNDTKGKRDQDGKIIKKSRYEKLLEDVIKSGIKTRVLLLSATPVNNNLKDLRNQIQLITEGREQSVSISNQLINISQVLKNAQREFNQWVNRKKIAQCSSTELLERLDSAFFILLDELTIARSRKHIKNYYDIKKIGDFPQRLQPISKSPQIDSKGEFPTYDKLNQSIMKYQLSLFKPSSYLKQQYQDQYKGKIGSQFDQSTREYYLIGMMKVNFLKRLESSIKSFEVTLERTIEKISILQNQINTFKGHKDISINFDEDIYNILGDEEYDVVDISDDFVVGKKLKYKLEHLDLDRWMEDLEEDKKQLIALYNDAKNITVQRDCKLETLKDIIKHKVSNPINMLPIKESNKSIPNKKVIVFTAFADTAYYLYDALREWSKQELGLDIAIITGGNKENNTTFNPKGYKKQNDYDEILINFAPRSKHRDKMSTMPQVGEIDILIATDCISEGQNLQDADYLVNYDIHWNPVRIIQRFGRIDRLQSTNTKIQLVNFWPTDDLNKYINLKDRVEARMALADLTATCEENPLEIDQVKKLEEEELKYRDKQLLKLKDEILDLEEIDDNITFSEFTLDDFRIELSNFLEKNKEKLEEMPLGLYAVVPTPDCNNKSSNFQINQDKNINRIIQPGVIFCLRQKEPYEDKQLVNPLQPYFLIYIYNDGNVRFNYVHTKQILEVYRLLCSGKKEPYEELCNIFDDETNKGRNMTEYSILLRKAVQAIRETFTRRNNQNLRSKRDAILIADNKQAKHIDQFELISWLIIKNK